jgi:hypothetical protein
MSKITPQWAAFFGSGCEEFIAGLCCVRLGSLLRECCFAESVLHHDVRRGTTDFNLVTLLMADGFIEVSDPLYVELMHLDQEGANLKRDLQNSRIEIKTEPNSPSLFSKLSKEDQKHERSAFFKELEGVYSLQEKLTWLLRRIKVS